MATTIKIDYDRKFTDSKVQQVVQRAAATINVFQQLGANFQSLPGYAMTDFQTEADGLEGKLAGLIDVISQIEPILRDIDALAEPLDDKNKGALSTLQGLLQTDAQKALLDQIPRVP